MCFACDIKTAFQEAIDRATGAVDVSDLVMVTGIELGELPPAQVRKIAVNLPDRLALIKFDGWTRDTRTSVIESAALVALDTRGLAALFSAINAEVAQMPEESRDAFWGQVADLQLQRDAQKAGTAPACACGAPAEPISIDREELERTGSTKIEGFHHHLYDQEKPADDTEPDRDTADQNEGEPYRTGAEESAPEVAFTD